ncbi:MAG: hypothetical protein ACI3Y5_06450 [Prevotella sp.]
MKKIFTLIAAAFMAASVNAQGSYGVQSGDPAVPAGTQVTSVDNITFTWGVTGGADFKGGNKSSSTLKDVLGATGYCEGNGENGKLTEGTVYYFEPTINGAITVGFVLNASKAFFVQDIDGNNVDFTMTDAEGNAVELANGGKLADKLTGGLVKFNVAAGKKYAVYCTGSKLGFYGFKLEAGGSSSVNAIEAEKTVNAPAYNVAGQRVSDNAKGLIIKNGKKVIR